MGKGRNGRRDGMGGKQKAELIWHREAQKEVQNIALDTNFSIPGDPGFPLNQVRIRLSTCGLFRCLQRMTSAWAWMDMG
jgi:hypothetical protein